MTLGKLFVDTFQGLIHLLGIGLTSAYEVSENDCIVHNFYMECKECPIIAYANAIDVAVADKFLAVGDVFKAFGILDFHNDSSHGVKHLAGKFHNGFLEVLGVI